VHLALGNGRTVLPHYLRLADLCFGARDAQQVTATEALAARGWGSQKPCDLIVVLGAGCWHKFSLAPARLEMQ